VVTFENTDPLFTLDLSDPRDPRVIGELEVPGFSTFIVPMDADHLLTVGQYVPPPGEFGNWGVQVSIFDVTDFANPVRQSNYIVGDDTGAYSEAIWNPKAFTYYAASGMVALPLSVYDNLVFLDDVAIGVEGEASGGASDGDATDAAPPPDEAGADGDSSSGSDGSAGDQDVAIDEPVDSIEPYVPQGFEGVLVLKATVADGLAEMGRISSRFEEAGYYWASFTRGVFIGDDVMAVTNHGLRGAPANTVEPTTFELLYSSAAESKPQ
jgi:hypothetical protein